MWWSHVTEIAFLALALFAAPSPCFAWGAEGHRIVATIAADELTPAARQQVSDLLGGNDAKAAMVSVSTWADQIAGLAAMQNQRFGRPKRPILTPA
jgi:hypothetical protein